MIDKLIQLSISKLSQNNVGIDSIYGNIFSKISNLNKTPDICSIKNLDKNINDINNSINNLEKNINYLILVIDNIQKVNKYIIIISASLKVAINVIKTVTYVTPTSVPPGVGIPSGLIISAANNLQKYEREISILFYCSLGLNVILDNQRKTMNITLNKLNDLKNLINITNSKLSKCGNKSINSIDKSIENYKNVIPIENIQKYDNLYKGFKLEILEEDKIKNSPIKVNRRYGAAFNSKGLLSFTTPPTYSTNDNLIINELKLIIDKENLQG